MRLGTPSQCVDISLLSIKGAEPKPGDDVLLAVRAECNGFVGDSTVWVLAPQWRDFVDALTELDRTRQGSAELNVDLIEDRVHLRIFSTDRAGHMAVTGMVAYHMLEKDADPCVFSFGRIPFDPSVLPDLVREMSAARAP